MRDWEPEIANRGSCCVKNVILDLAMLWYNRTIATTKNTGHMLGIAPRMARRRKSDQYSRAIRAIGGL
jgi:hypothetical protein